MNNFINKIKWYVILAVLIVTISSVLISFIVKNNFYYSFNTIARSMVSSFIKDEYTNRNFENTFAVAENGLNQDEVDYKSAIPVIVYHGIPYSDIANDYSITLSGFKDHMFALKQAGYTTIGTSELYSYLKTGVISVEKPVIITFDDGRIDSFKMADPVLNALDFKAVMFAIGRYSILNERQKYYISSNQLKEMDKNGRWEIGAHSFDGHNSYAIAPNEFDGHFFSHKQWNESENRLETENEFSNRISEDFLKVKSGLENLLSHSVDIFAYPYGDFGQNDTNYINAKEINVIESQKYFKLSFYQNDPLQRFTNNYYIQDKADDNFFLIKRIEAHSDWSGGDLLHVLNISAPKLLPYYDDFQINKGWLKLWGDTIIENNILSLNAVDTDSGATTILDGSRLWKNYSLNATVSDPGKSNVYVWARFVDDNNNVACNFGNGFIHIDQTINGVKRTIKGQIDSSYVIPNNDFIVEVRVKDRELKCILNGQSSVETPYLDESLIDGGIGFKVWQQGTVVAKLEIKRLSVEEI